MLADTVLLVEPDRPTAQLLSSALTDIGLQVEIDPAPALALQKAKQQHYALVVLNSDLPQMSGLRICKTLRHHRVQQAIMIVQTQHNAADRLLSFELGADDWISVPLDLLEFQARVNALLRKVKLLHNGLNPAENDVGTVLKIRGLTIDPLQHQVRFNHNIIPLTVTEFALLYFLARHPNQVFSRIQLLQSVWGYDHSGYEHTVNSHINRLRRKMTQQSATPAFIETVWGIGYKFAAPSHSG